MRELCWISLASLAVSLPCIAQNAVPGELPKDPKAILALAEPQYDFADPQMKPWHFKASYQLYDRAGNPAQQGTFEYWWASPQVYRSTWTRVGATRSEWHTAMGKWLGTASGEEIHLLEFELPQLLLSPWGGNQPYDPAKSWIERTVVDVGKLKAPCVQIIDKGEGPGRRTYCFDPKEPIVFMAMDGAGVETEFGHFVRVQGRAFPRSILEAVSGRKLLAATVDTLDGLNAADPALKPSVDAKADLVAYRPSSTVSSQRIGGLMPEYPSEAKVDRIQGAVIFDTIIGKDGRVQDLDLISSPAPILEQAARKAVLTWVYKPFLVDGDPVEIRTRIRVIFQLGG